MSFFSDKEFGRGARAHSTKKPVSIGTKARAEETKKTDDVVERARIEREERARKKINTAIVIKIQSWWRGISTAVKTIAILRKEFDSKLTDIENLSTLLRDKNNIVFIPPVPICMDLAKKLTAFGYHGLEVRERHHDDLFSSSK